MYQFYKLYSQDSIGAILFLVGLVCVFLFIKILIGSEHRKKMYMLLSAIPFAILFLWGIMGTYFMFDSSNCISLSLRLLPAWMFIFTFLWYLYSQRKEYIAILPLEIAVVAVLIDKYILYNYFLIVICLLMTAFLFIPFKGACLWKESRGSKYVFPMSGIGVLLYVILLGYTEMSIKEYAAKYHFKENNSKQAELFAIECIKKAEGGNPKECLRVGLHMAGYGGYIDEHDDADVFDSSGDMAQARAFIERAQQLGEPLAKSYLPLMDSLEYRKGNDEVNK